MIDDQQIPDRIDIIPLTPALWETYKDIRLEALLEDPQAFGRSYTEESAYPPEKWIQRAGNPYSFLAVENGVAIGTMGAFVEPEDASVVHIVGVFVSKDARGKGIGSRLMSAVLEKIRTDPAIRTVRLGVNKDQIPAVRLYEKFGFHITGEETQTMGDGKEHTEYLMELTL